MADIIDRVREHIDPAIQHLRETGGTLLARVRDEDRELVERCLRRGAELHALILLDADNDDAKAEVRIIANTLQFVHARYEIDGAAAMNEFTRKVFDRLISAVITAAFAA